MDENVIDFPISEKIKNILKKPLIICVTPEKKGKNFLKGEDDESLEDNTNYNSDTGWNEYEVDSGCSPCCSPCSPCLPHTNREQCGPDDNNCYPQCSPCNPCYPCMPIENFDRDRE